MSTSRPTEGAAEHGKANLVWAHQERSGRGPVPQLSRDRIVAAGIAVADAEGAQALSMRRVAGKLDAGTMSLYRHVSSKDDLLELMLDAVLDEVRPQQKPSGDWRADLAAMAHRDRAVFLRHPWALPLAASRPSLGPNALAIVEFALTALHHLGLDVTAMSQMFSTVRVYVLGSVQSELAEAETQRRTGLGEEEWRAAVAPYVRQVVESGRYPNWSRLVVDGEDVDPEKSFCFGLDRVLDGLASYLEGHSNS